MANNGTGTLGQGTRVTLQLLFAVLGVVIVLTGAYFSSQVAVAGHVANADIHHGTEQLDKRYAGKDQMADSLADIKARLVRIENKVDKLEGR